MIRIAFFDIDGTLLDFGSKSMTPRMEETLSRLHDAGVLLCIATGRAPLTLPWFAHSGFDIWMTFNGSWCFDRDGQIFSNPLPKDGILKVVANAASIGRPVSLATKDRFAANGLDSDLLDYYGISGFRLEVADDFMDIIDKEDVYQLMMGCYPTEYDAVMDGVEGARIAAWWDRAVDIIPSDGGKGRALLHILERYGIDPDDAIAFGDGDNDIEMLKAAGTGIAMGNASDALRAAADDVCRTAAEDGIYHYCLSHGLI